jgi:hypothetical protein
MAQPLWATTSYYRDSFAHKAYNLTAICEQTVDVSHNLMGHHGLLQGIALPFNPLCNFSHGFEVILLSHVLVHLLLFVPIKNEMELNLYLDKLGWGNFERRCEHMATLLCEEVLLNEVVTLQHNSTTGRQGFLSININNVGLRRVW